MLLRDARAGELRVLALGLVLAVGGIASVAFFADRVRQALTREAHQVLGADVLMTADHAWTPEFRDEIARRGLSRAESMNFVSMARAGNETLLAAVKAVSPGYPLRGKLRIAPGLNVPDSDTDAVPPRGMVWLDERMMAALKVGRGDAIEVGRARFRVGAVLTLEPDRGVSFMNFAPRLMVRLEDLPATGLVQPGSRINYQLLAAGEREGIRQFEQWARARLGRGERIDSLETARPLSGVAGCRDRIRAPSRLRLAASAPAQGSAGPTRDPARRRPSEARGARRIHNGTGCGVRAASLACWRAQARELRVRRVCGCLRPFRGDRLRSAAADRPVRPDRKRLLALRPGEPSAAPACQCRADRGDRSGTHRDPAAHHDPGRFARRLARTGPAGRARPVSRKHPARATTGSVRIPRAQRRGAPAGFSHGACAASRHQRKTGRCGGLFGG